MTCILGTIADRGSPRRHMITVALLSNHRVSARNLYLFLNLTMFSSILVGVSFTQNGSSERGLQGAAPLGTVATARDLTWFAFCSACQEETLAQFNFCWKCGVQPVRSLPAPWYPQQAPVVVDVEKIQTRRHQVLMATEERPGQLRERATLALASYHCRLSFKHISQRVRERIDQKVVAKNRYICLLWCQKQVHCNTKYNHTPGALRLAILTSYLFLA